VRSPCVCAARRLTPRRRGAYLTPAEMDALTAPWRPYRSVGVYYMWALADAEVGGAPARPKAK
jgi:3-methyladenine DNA glycosylase/8-oxoguanine DNA glycosylase